jgi:1-acyl-sn-glycerol-3-phosphate acyltransferase
LSAISHCVERFRGDLGRPRFTVADWLITLPFAQPYLARLGGVRACRENVDRLLRTGHSVAVFPEGVKGAAKVFRERYRLQRFGRGGVIRVAIECGIPLVPVGIVGAEEAHPILFKWVPPGRPLPFVPVTPTFPWLGPLGMLPLPSKWVIRVGSPVDLSDLGAEAARDELLMSRLTEDLRAEIQALVDLGLSERESVWG